MKEQKKIPSLHVLISCVILKSNNSCLFIYNLSPMDIVVEEGAPIAQQVGEMHWVLQIFLLSIEANLIFISLTA